MNLCSSDNHYTTAPFLLLFAEHKDKDDDEEDKEYEHKKKGILFLPRVFREGLSSTVVIFALMFFKYQHETVSQVERNIKTFWYIQQQFL